MKQIFVTLGSLLAAASAIIFFAGRSVNRRQALRKVSAAQAAEQLRTAWADAHTQV